MRRVADSRTAQQSLALGVIGIFASSIPLVAIGGAAPASAYWTASTELTSGSITAGTIPAPAISCGSLAVLSVQFSWTAVADVTNYEFHYTENGAASVTLPSTQTTYSRSGTLVIGEHGDAWVYALRNFGQTTWGSPPSNTLGYGITFGVLAQCDVGDHPAGPWPYSVVIA